LYPAWLPHQELSELLIGTRTKKEQRRGRRLAKYLFFTDTWEMVVWWHVTIEPHDWAHIYLRRRFVEMVPSYGFKIDSVKGGDDPHPRNPTGPSEPLRRGVKITWYFDILVRQRHEVVVAVQINSSV
jgi:hypothetical protein